MLCGALCAVAVCPPARQPPHKSPPLSPPALQALCRVFHAEASAHLQLQPQASGGPFSVESLTELSSMVKRLAGDDAGLQALVAGDAHATLCQVGAGAPG